MTNPLLGQINPIGFTFAPLNWAFCDGQLLAISSNTALFSLLGTIYGGDGRTTFALPDLRGRVPMHAGNGPGLSSRSQGQQFGTENNTLSTSQLPSHSHTVSISVSSAAADSSTPDGNHLATGITPAAGPVPERPAQLYKTGATPDGTLNGGTTNPAGSGQAVNNMPPVLVVYYCIATAGVFPARP